MEFLSPKASANRMKAKGLQKLRWYCQMCQKQCHDRNGFKCHCMSDSHQRQMHLFAQDPTRVVQGYSEQFQSAFLDHIKCFSCIAATVAYNEYIAADRHHVHMNSTRWATLTEFVKYLGKTGKCMVEDTPKGWFITYIDREKVRMMKNKRIYKAMDIENQEKEIQRQIERATQQRTMMAAEANEELEGRIESSRILMEKNINDGAEGDHKKIKLSLGLSKKKNVATNERRESSKFLLFDEEVGEYDNNNNNNNNNNNKSRKRKRDEVEKLGNYVSVLDELMREEEKAKERRQRHANWHKQ